MRALVNPAAPPAAAPDQPAAPSYKPGDQKALDRLEVGQGRGGLQRRGPGNQGGYPPGGGRRGGGGGGTLLYDGAFLGSDELAKSRAGQVASRISGRYLLDNGETVLVEAHARLLLPDFATL